MLFWGIFDPRFSPSNLSEARANPPVLLCSLSRAQTQLQKKGLAVWVSWSLGFEGGAKVVRWCSCLRTTCRAFEPYPFRDLTRALACWSSLVRKWGEVEGVLWQVFYKMFYSRLLIIGVNGSFLFKPCGGTYTLFWQSHAKGGVDFNFPQSSVLLETCELLWESCESVWQSCKLVWQSLLWISVTELWVSVTELWVSVTEL